MRTYPIVLCALLAACGGATFTGPTDGGTDTGSNGDSATDGGGGPSKCPATMPFQDAACASEGLKCEYGSNPILSCNAIAVCQSGKWSLMVPPPDGCMDPGPNPKTCPATFASVPRGQSCSDAYPTFCSYPQGQCGCTVAAGPIPMDASASATWICESPGAGCPRPRPHVGDACASAGLVCDYGSCTLPSGIQLECSGGVWTDTPAPCPL
jgi:hypothetical protein